MSGLLAKLNILLWVYAIGLFIEHFQWGQFLLFVGYMAVYYVILYWFYQQDRMFEFYWLGFGCAFLALLFILVAIRNIPPQPTSLPFHLP